jgi:hypothetical protein
MLGGPASTGGEGPRTVRTLESDAASSLGRLGDRPMVASPRQPRALNAGRPASMGRRWRWGYRVPDSEPNAKRGQHEQATLHWVQSTGEWTVSNGLATVRLTVLATRGGPPSPAGV